MPTTATTQAPAAPAPCLWDAEGLDPDAYFTRIGYDGPREPSIETLTRLHRLHLAAFSFETIDIGLRTPGPVTTRSLQERFVTRGRGGCCIEHNLLFAAVLESLGFTVRRHLARVRRGNRGDLRFRSHVTLTVEAEGRLFLADVGFGDEGPLHPVPLLPGTPTPVTVGAWTWKVDQEDEETWALRSLHAHGWFDVYAFGFETTAPADIEVSYHYTTTHPRSVFTDHITAQRGEDRARYVLRDRTLRTQHPDGTSEERQLTCDQVIAELRARFRIALTAREAAAVRALLDAQA
ncbi:arylamine N-acetyltransferase [Kitasatospora sp. NPDC093558]|uniref:arylamine N-acetyltransferase family protein n=1 Tax=Kitasatospora sp. NPDC093558 TaxID=3155201 RepID=UPI003443CA6E